MKTTAIRIDADERGIANLTLARPAKHNALNAAMISELTEAARHLAADTSVRVIVVRGEGESFCAGGDLDWMKSQAGATRTERIDEARKLAMMLRAWNELPKPVIAAVHGAAYGGGVGLISVCDNSVAAETAKFGLTETRLGLIPATIAPYVAARLGGGAARRIFMSSRLFSAQDAMHLGLVGSVVPAGDIDVAIEKEARAYLATAPGAVAAAKALLLRLNGAISDDVIEETITKLADTWDSPEAAEGINAFFEKRKPIWSK